MNDNPVNGMRIIISEPNKSISDKKTGMEISEKNTQYPQRLILYHILKQRCHIQGQFFKNTHYRE